MDEGGKEAGVWQYVQRQNLSVGSGGCVFQRFLTFCCQLGIRFLGGGRKGWEGVEKADAKRDY